MAEDATNVQQTALVRIQQFIIDVCPLEQRSKASTVEVAGLMNAKLKGLVGQLVDLGVAGQGTLTETETVGVLQEDLLPALSDRTNCRLRMMEILADNPAFVWK